MRKIFRDGDKQWGRAWGTDLKVEITNLENEINNVGSAWGGDLDRDKLCGECMRGEFRDRDKQSGECMLEKFISILDKKNVGRTWGRDKEI